MGWPQIVIICLYGIRLILELVLHGHEKHEKYNFWETLVCSAIGIWILYMGGFFGK